MAKTVAAKLKSELVELATTTPHRPGTVNLAAHNLYLQGRYHLSQRTEEGMRKAIELFEKSLAEDAQYGLAHSGLSDAYACSRTTAAQAGRSLDQGGVHRGVGRHARQRLC